MDNEHSNQYQKPLRSRLGTMPLILALLCLGAVALGMWVRDREQVDAMNAERAHMEATLNQSLAQSKSQIQELNSRIEALTVAQARAHAPASKPPARSTRR